MANKKFLEEYPLYRKFIVTDFYDWTPLSGIPKPAIHMYCWRCDSEQTFNMVNDYWEVDHSRDSNSVGKTLRMRYVCSACSGSVRLFFIQFGSEKITVKDEEGKDSVKTVVNLTKVGQNPPWSIEMDKELERMLSEHSEYYRRGLICESQSYGIGAYAYFRRITEDVIDELLESILDLVEEREKKEYQEKLEQVKREKTAENKINLVKDLLPKSLQVDGMNLLKELYGALSQGIHDKTDEECMEKAEVIRGILVFLVNQIMRTKQDKKSFTDGMKKILQK